MSFEIPKTRSEKILQNILGAKNEIEPIQSRIEAILFAILNDTEIGDPYTAPARCEIEKLLVAIKDGGEYNETPLTRSGRILLCKLRGEDYTGTTQSRLEKLFLRWLYELMEITDVPPFTFKSKGNNLIDYDIYGAEDGVGDNEDNTVSGNPISVSDAIEAPADSLQVTFTPTQDGTPSIDSEPETSPYLSKLIPRGNKEYYSLVGGTVAWNQLCRSVTTTTNNGITFTNNGDGSYTLNGTANGTAVLYFELSTSTMLELFVLNHKILVPYNLTATQRLYIQAYSNKGGEFCSYRSAITSVPDITGTTGAMLRIRVESGTVLDNVKIIPQLFDLTLMFANEPAIADYAYSLEQSEAGSGIAWLKSYGFFTKEYYPYNAGELISVNTSGKKIVGFNQWDEQWEVGNISDNTGENYVLSTLIRSKNFNKALPNTTYYANIANYNTHIFCYDDSYNYLGYLNRMGNGTFTTLPNTAYFRFRMNTAYGTTYNHNVCINISDPQKNGTYKPYVTTTYPIDPTDLRGLFNLSNGKLYCEGDIYPPSGNVSRKYGIIDMGTLNWSYSSPIFYVNVSNINIKFQGKLICTLYENRVVSLTNPTDKSIYVANSQELPIIRVADSAYTDADTFNASMDGVYLVYELATPTTESATPYTSPATVEAGGAEEFVDSRTVPIPVGNETYYASEYEIHGKTGVTVSHGAAEDDPNPTEYEIEFTSQGTVYGGTVDIVSGGLTVEWGNLDNLGSRTWSKATQGGHTMFYSSLPGGKQVDEFNGLLTIYPSGNDRVYSIDKCARFYGSTLYGGFSRVGIRDDSFDDATAFKSAMSGAQLVYELAEPQTYNLTPQEVQMLLNDNYLTTPDGTITLTYKGPGINVPFSVSCGGESNSYRVDLSDKLYKVGAYADSISYDDQTVKREIEVLRLTGSEEWVLNDGVFSTMLSVLARTPAVLCNELTTDQCYISEDLTTINITNVPQTSVEELASWLMANDIYVKYVRENTLVTSHMVPAVSTFNGTNTFSVDTDVTPSEVTIIYPNRVTTRALPKTKKIGKSKLTKSK